MKKKIILCVSIFVMNNSASNGQVPKINSVDYDEPMAQSSLLKIQGNNFGIKNPACPLVWDDLEDGSCNSSATIGHWAGGTNGGVNQLSISSSNQRGSSSYNAVGNFGIANNYMNFTKNDVTHDRYFTSYWFRLSDNYKWNTAPSGAANNIKHWRVFVPGGTTVTSRHTFTYHGWEDDFSSGSDFPTCWQPNPRTYWDNELSTRIQGGDWHHNQYIWRESSARGNDDGVMEYIMDGERAVRYAPDASQQVITYCNEPDSRYKYLLHIGWYDSWGGGIPDDYYVYLDDVYVDTTWARVEIGDAQVYTSCHHREMQIPLKWNSEEIEIRLNLGSLKIDQRLYLFVIDKNGVSSTGFPVSSQNSSYPKKPLIEGIFPDSQ